MTWAADEPLTVFFTGPPKAELLLSHWAASNFETTISFINVIRFVKKMGFEGTGLYFCYELPVTITGLEVSGLKNISPSHL